MIVFETESILKSILFLIPFLSTIEIGEGGKLAECPVKGKSLIHKIFFSTFYQYISLFDSRFDYGIT